MKLLPFFHLLLLVSFLISCNDSNSEFNKTIQQTKKLDIVKNEQNQKLMSEIEKKEKNITFKEKIFRTSTNIDEFLLFDSNPEIYPGAIVRINDISKGQLDGVFNSNRSGSTITLSQVGSSFAKKIDAANVQTTIFDILKNLNNSQQADFNILSLKTENIEKSCIEAKIEIGWLPAKFKAGVKNKNSHKSSESILIFRQVYYTASFEAPDNPKDLFNTEANLAEISKTIIPNNPYAYVSQVSYGRQVIIKTKKQGNIKELETNIEARLMGAKSGINNQSYSSLKEEKIDALIIGGRAKNGTNLLKTDNVKSLLDILEKDNTVSVSNPGVPISYKLKYLSDNSTVAYGKEVEFKEYEYKKQKIQVELTGFRIIKDCDGFLEGWGEFYYDFNILDKNGNQLVHYSKDNNHCHNGRNGQFVESLQEKKIFEIDKSPDNFFKISGALMENDNGKPFLVGKIDEIISFPWSANDLSNRNKNDKYFGYYVIPLKNGTNCEVEVWVKFTKL